MGYRCELTWYLHSKKAFRNGDHCLITVPMKQASEPIDLSMIYWMLSPMFFRSWIIGIMNGYTGMSKFHGSASMNVSNDAEVLECNESEIINL